ncbi:thiamine pyrophosphate-dependent acetolactate synthase large subunit-like protein [Azospirillum canadense]|nr:thiamine pyrophosphate-dependent acetolactate synthase large subunit-like protein [Azospirillum canadense]
MFANPTASHWVAEAHGLPVLTIIFNNQLYGAVRNATMAMYKTGVAACDGGRMLADLSPAPAYEKLVEASGGTGFRVERPEQLCEALRQAVAVVTTERRQALVNVLCDYCCRRRIKPSLQQRRQSRRAAGAPAGCRRGPRACAAASRRSPISRRRPGGGRRVSPMTSWPAG